MTERRLQARLPAPPAARLSQSRKPPMRDNSVMRISLFLLLLAGLLPAATRFQVKLAPEAGSTARDGRLIVVVSRQMQGEPRFQVAWGLGTQQIFGKDVDGWKPGDSVEMGADTAGAPLRTLADLPPGTYNIQAVLNVYETFHRADGHRSEERRVGKECRSRWPPNH